MSSSHVGRLCFERLARPSGNKYGWRSAVVARCPSRRAASTNVPSRKPRKIAHDKPAVLSSISSAPISTNPGAQSRNAPSKSDRKLPSSPTIRISPHKAQTPLILRSSKDVYKEDESTVTPTAEAIAAAETRSAMLNAARLRRSLQREEEEALKAKKDEEKKKYQKRYKSNTRKWISTMIALPIFFVTSYYLFDRLALGNAQKEMPKLNKSED